MARDPVDANRPHKRVRRLFTERPDGGSAARRIAWAVVGAVSFVAAKLAPGF